MDQYSDGDIIKQECQPLTARWTRGRAIFHTHKLAHSLHYVILCTCQRGRGTKLTADLTQTLPAAFPVPTLWIWYQIIFCHARLNPTSQHSRALRTNRCTTYMVTNVTFVLRVIYCEPHCFLGHLAEAILPAVLPWKGRVGGGGWLHFGILTVLINLDRREMEHLDDSKMWNMVGRWGHSECYDQFGKL